MAWEPSSLDSSLRVKPVDEVISKVKFLRQCMAETSCTVKDNFFRAVVCQEKKSMGYFVPNHKVSLFKFKIAMYTPKIHKWCTSTDSARSLGLDPKHVGTRWLGLIRSKVTKLRITPLLASPLQHAEAERKAAHSNTLAQGSLPPPSPGSRRFHFLLFPLSGTQVAQLVVPIFPGFSVRGLEQLAVGSPLAVASPIAVVSPVAIRVFVEDKEEWEEEIIVFLHKLLRRTK
ncbi:hypothetical protein Ahy_A02g008323 isoform B [Arachis hypogaea]|uniref:Uncharacterized protein n=1 Tax=Arachis hypogaea TaxID=3818 RepID=A0A445EE81_ARAHY|nr:hypothetical protein Ahy_A02g008323 isoform B [Arachis hypogaea]